MKCLENSCENIKIPHCVERPSEYVVLLLNIQWFFSFLPDPICQSILGMFHQGWKFGCDCSRNQRRKCNSFRRQIHLWKCKKFVKFVQEINKEIFSLPNVCLFKSSVEKTLMEKPLCKFFMKSHWTFFYNSMILFSNELRLE